MKKRKFSRSGVIVSYVLLASLLFGCSGGSASGLSVGPSGERLLFQNSTYDKAVNEADQKGRVQRLEASCEKENIKVDLIGAINDGERVLLQIEVYNNGKLLKFDELTIPYIELTDQSGTAYSFLRFGGGDNTKPDEATIIEFQAGIPDDQELTLKFFKINETLGGWELQFPIKGKSVSLKEYSCDYTYEENNMTFHVSTITESETNVKIHLVVTGDLAFYTSGGAVIYSGNNEGRYIGGQGRNTADNQRSDEMVFEHVPINGDSISIKLEYYREDINFVYYQFTIPLGTQ